VQLTIWAIDAFDLHLQYPALDASREIMIIGLFAAKRRLGLCSAARFSRRVRRASALFVVVGSLFGCSTVEVTDLGSLGGASVATGVNEFGLIVGTSREGGSDLDLPVQFKDGRATRLQLPPGDRSCTNLVVNRASAVLGSCYSSDARQGAHLARLGTNTSTNVGTVQVGWSTFATEINDDNFAVGWAADPLAPEHKQSWIYGLMPLQLLFPSPNSTGEILGVNNVGLFVGSFRMENGPTFPVIWMFSGFDTPPPQYRLQGLGVPPSCQQGRAHDINNRQLIVGECDGIPLVWQGGPQQFAILPVPPPDAGDLKIMVSAIAANDANEIIGTVTHHRSDGVRVTGVGWTAERQLVNFGDVEPMAINNAGLTVGRRGNRAVQIVW
jgi:hypothetical protein